MRLGFHLPQMGQAATPENVLLVAKEAEDTGFDSVWVTERRPAACVDGRVSLTDERG